MQSFRSEVGPFKTKFAENIFNHKYSHNGQFTWESLAVTVVDDVCGSFQGKEEPLLSKEDRDDITKYISEMKFIPGGRYLYYAGRPFHAWNNCLGGEVEILTDAGWIKLKDKVNHTVNVISPIDGASYPAKINSHGTQRLNKITLGLHRGQGKKKWTVRATRDHHWPLVGGKDTYNLKVGDRIPASAAIDHNSLAFIHGIFFGDGTFHRVREKDNTNTFQLRLCGGKSSFLPFIENALNENNVEYTVTHPESYNGDPVVRIWIHDDFKALPDNSCGISYIGSFLRGWAAVDGCAAANQIHSSEKSNIEFFVEHAPYAGFVITGDIKSQIRDTAFKKNSEIFRVSFQHGSSFAGFKVLSIEEDAEEEVFCPFEPIHNRIILKDGIDSFNCYNFNCLDDTREEWGRIVHVASDALMVGGGIGNCYSALRPNGSKLSKTGGVSSGPLPLMKSVNEIGRSVIQGGIRRSAIYASLHWWHDDIQEFLHAKDWHKIKIGKAKKGNHDYTLQDAKIDDFNFPAPLDMTNISVNYDDGILDSIKSDTPHPIYVDNVRQALMTGDPGFSFNFGKYINEYLRNACTENTSEDDSDMCNLGSLNLGNIVSIEELRHVVQCAVKFLLCGTIRAKLPGEKFYQVREKNRRIGLGLMGVHEWLLQRRYRYEINEELKTWLQVYQNDSRKTADETCDKLSISRSKAIRAIAPTGTIGIMASTTTGIEPLFATAFKRRYLVSGSQWKYEYVVDATADRLISDYSLDPSDIETASSLASDYERRIKFQADVQDYVDMAISSTINLPSWGSDRNNEDTVIPFAKTLAKYCDRLRGFTCYPNGARGGQPLTEVEYEYAKKHKGMVFDEVDICDISNRGGTCGG